MAADVTLAVVPSLRAGDRYHQAEFVQFRDPMFVLVQIYNPERHATMLKHYHALPVIPM